jgi:hypothetical protein
LKCQTVRVRLKEHRTQKGGLFQLNLTGNRKVRKQNGPKILLGFVTKLRVKLRIHISKP